MATQELYDGKTILESVREEPKPDYPFHGNFMIVDHHCADSMGGEKQCFLNLNRAVEWAGQNLDHDDYSVYKLTIVL